MPSLLEQRAVIESMIPREYRQAKEAKRVEHAKSLAYVLVPLLHYPLILGNQRNISKAILPLTFALYLAFVVMLPVHIVLTRGY